MHGIAGSDHARNSIDYLRARCDFRSSTSADFLYEHMQSQSGCALPVVYIPFNPDRRAHWRDRGQILDFAVSVRDGRVLDFGPGDGWPSLPLSYFVAEVVGVEGSARRVETCRENARRLGRTNVSFLYVSPGEPLPFADGEFDGVVASSSIEQTPNPKATLAELYRVLKPGGRLRIHYESLSWYKGREEQALWIVDDCSDCDSVDDDQRIPSAKSTETRLVIYDRHVEEGRVDHYGLVLDLPPTELMAIFTCATNANAADYTAKARSAGGHPSYQELTPAVIDALLCHVTQAVTWTTYHPSCRQLLGWLREAGFSSALPTHDGGTFAGQLFDRLPASQRPTTLEAVDAYLRPLIEIVTALEAPADSRPGQWDPWVTAVK